MYAKRHQLSLEFEMIRWMVIIGLSGILALAVASTAWGRDIPKRTPPRPLPDAARQQAKPMQLSSQPQSELQFADNEQLVRQLWSALAYHRGDDPSAAREVWNGIQLPPENEAWQYVALGVTYLQEGDCEAASMSFQVAKSLQPDNPVPSYYMGLVRLTQAQRAENWRDATMPGKVQFVSQSLDLGQLSTPDVVPNSRAMYEWVAMNEFTQAIKLANNVSLDQPLVASAAVRIDPLTSEKTAGSPNVGDLLTALGADNFAGKAHNTLGSMQVMRGALESAERHLDEAAATGLTIVHGFTDLGAAFEEEGDHSGAVRAFMKAVANGDRSSRATHGVVENFGKALFDMR